MPPDASGNRKQANQDTDNLDADMSDEWKKTGSKYIGKSVARTIYDAKGLPVSSEVGTVVGWLPIEEADFVNIETNQPAALWHIKFDNAHVGEEDLEEHEVQIAIKEYKQEYTGKKKRKRTLRNDEDNDDDDEEFVPFARSKTRARQEKATLKQGKDHSSQHNKAGQPLAGSGTSSQNSGSVRFGLTGHNRLQPPHTPRAALPAAQAGTARARLAAGAAQGLGELGAGAVDPQRDREEGSARQGGGRLQAASAQHPGALIGEELRDSSQGAGDVQILRCSGAGGGAGLPLPPRPADSQLPPVSNAHAGASTAYLVVPAPSLRPDQEAPEEMPEDIRDQLQQVDENTRNFLIQMARENKRMKEMLANAAGAPAGLHEAGRAQPHGGGRQDRRIDPGGEEEFSSVEIDTEITRFRDEEVAVVQYIYRTMQSENKKADYFEGHPRYAMRKLNFKEPDQNVENVIWGQCQSGKSGEAAWVAWCSWFVLGCLPVILVRNSGGKVSGKDDMTRAIANLNQSICKLLEAQGRPPEEVNMFLLKKIFFEQKDIPDAQQGFGRTGSALIMLNNPAQLRKLAEDVTSSRLTFSPATLVREAREAGPDQAPAWIVTYDDAPAEEARVLVADLRRGSNKFTKHHAPAVGMSVKAKRGGQVNPSVLRVMGQYSLKKDRCRLVFVLDEADLVIGNPSRRGNVTDEWHFHKKIRQESRGSSTALGLREHVFGCVSITATPAAIFICSIETAVCPYCWKFFETGQQCVEVKHLFEDEEGPSLCHYAHIHCIKTDLDGAAQLSHRSFPCVKCFEETVRLENVQQVERGPCRRLKPHVVETDKPDNYVRYTTKPEESEHQPENPWLIKRQETPERPAPRLTQYEAYKEYFVFETREKTEEEWSDLETLCKQENAKQDVFEDISMRWNGAKFEVCCPRKSRRSDEVQRIFERVESLRQSSAPSQHTDALDLPKSIQADLPGIQMMVGSMLKDTERSFRHALILSDNTKMVEHQKKLFKFLLEQYNDFGGPRGLVLLQWDWKKFRVGFTDTVMATFSDPKGFQDDVRKSLDSQGLNHQVADSDVGYCLEIDNRRGINFVFEALKTHCSRIVVITGEIGGRGVPYHDLEHERILTDMFTGQNVPDERQLTAHGEGLLQLAGRLNTIHSLHHTLSRAPEISLWASKSVHALHMLYLRQTEELVQSVMLTKNYKEALRLLPQYVSGERADGTVYTTPSTKPKFRATEDSMRQGGRISPAAGGLPKKRKRHFREDNSKGYLHPVSDLHAQAHYPVAMEDADPESCNWTPESGEWDEREFTRWELGLSPDHVAASQGQWELLTAQDADSQYTFPDLFEIRDAQQEGFKNLAFKRLSALQSFIVEGAAGQSEQGLMKAHLNMVHLDS